LLYIFAPIYALLIPMFFFLIAWKFAGHIRAGALLCSIDFMILYVGRTLHATLIKPWFEQMVGWKPITLLFPPSLVLLALFFIVSGSQILGRR